MTLAARILLTLPLLYSFFSGLVAQPLATDPAHHHAVAHDHDHEPTAPALRFIPNHRQWDDRIAYVSELGGLNKLLLEADRFTFVLFKPEQVATLHDRMQEFHDDPDHLGVDGHVYSVNFVGAQQPVFAAEGTADHQRNYLLGQDRSRWARRVPLHDKVIYQELYPGVDLEAYSEGGNFKYDFVLRPGANAGAIALNYDGIDRMTVTDGDLVLSTTVGELRELRPYAYQLIDGKRVEVPCNYVLQEQMVTFAFPEGYDPAYELVIDPTVIGATLAGSAVGESFGHSATFDNGGNMYGVGICFGTDYPTTTGAFQQFFAGGLVDIAVSKFNPEGTELIYATYIGGADAEYPHSTIVDNNGQFSLYGTTRSSNYPVTENAVQAGLRGGTDIIVTKLTPDGSDLVGSTYLGGIGVDGLNESFNNFGSGDRYRGEIVLDNNGNIYIASCSSSSDFPITPGTFQQQRAPGGQFGESQDGVIVKMNSDLSTLFWSTYIGGTGNDLATSLRVDDNFDVYVSGYASSDDFPMVSGGVTENWPGGGESAWIVKLAANGTQLLRGTYWGTGENDRSYFLDDDELGQIHVFGLSRGNMPVTEGVYSSGNNAQQFVSGFTQDLDQVVYSTVIGSPSNQFSTTEFSPIAFMVDKCNGIYLSGHSSGENLPLTNDAVYEEGNSFYLMKLEPDATALTFASYYGRANHVDGGTSRFDKGGIVYQGVCSCTTGDRVMDTTPGAFRENQITRCDIGVFKIDFDVDVVTASGVASPSTSGCAPLTIDFEYTGRDAQIVTWDFGNGDTGSGENITYTFEEPGSYRVMQVAESPLGCNPTDTFFLRIDVLDETSTISEREFCEGETPTFLDASTAGATYNWQDGSTAATYQPEQAGTYWVDISVEGCTRRDSFILTPLSDLAVDLGEDLRLCDEPSFVLDASSDIATAYEWQDNSSGATLEVTTSGVYAVTLTDANDCRVSDQITVNFSESADIELGDDQVVCEGDVVVLDATTSGATYTWQDGSTGATLDVTEPGLYRVDALRQGCPSADSVFIGFEQSPTLEVTGNDRVCPAATNGSINLVAVGGGADFAYAWDGGVTGPDRFNLPPGDYAYTVTNEIGCVTVGEQAIVETTPVTFGTEVDDVPCDEEFGGAIFLVLGGGGTPPYRFALSNGVTDSLPLFDGLPGGDYTVTVEDALGCTVTQPATVIQPRDIVVDAGVDQLIRFGDSIRLRGTVNATNDLVFEWTPALELDCTDCPEPWARPLEARSVYTFTVTDALTGCTYRDSMTLRVSQERNVYLPSAFSPNGDGVNDLFYVYSDQSVEAVNYFRVFNRWGGLLHERTNFAPNDPNFGWDGLVNGRPAAGQVAVYALEVRYLDGRTQVFEGDVLLMR